MTRTLKVTGRRTNPDFAQSMKDLVDLHFSAAAVIRVTNNRNTHTPIAPYEAFEPAEARRIIHKLEYHLTPKHGRWLNWRKSSSRCWRVSVWASGSLTLSGYELKLPPGKLSVTSNQPRSNGAVQLTGALPA